MCFSFYICMHKIGEDDTCSFNDSFILEAVLNRTLCFSQVLEIHKTEMSHVGIAALSASGFLLNEFEWYL